MAIVRFATSARVIPWIALSALVVLLLVSWVVPVTAQKQSSKQTNQFKELLVQYQGQMTSLGTLKKVSGDYVTFADEQSTAMYPVAMIQCIRLTKDEESGTTKVEIRVLARE